MKDKSCLYKNFVRDRIFRIFFLIGTTLLEENSRRNLNYETVDTLLAEI